jgi:hypothetical protein
MTAKMNSHTKRAEKAAPLTPFQHKKRAGDKEEHPVKSRRVYGSINKTHF